MGSRRFTPLIAVVWLGAAVLIARLFTIQILEGDIWRAQADALVREGAVEPYTRGAILDRNGRVLARDVESYRIAADYRDFRRGNALGIVAHARSTLEQRPVPLAETRAELGAWAVALARLSPADLERFQRGEALDCGAVHIASTADPRADARSGRAIDLAYYATALFELQASERAKLKKLKGGQRNVAYVDWLAGVRRTSRAALEAALCARCDDDLAFLADFAALWARDNQDGAGAPLEGLIGELERWRGEVEDGAASDLFEAAAGFPAGRIEADALYEFVDLDWIRRALRWDEPRLAAWTRAARAEWLALRDGPLLDFAVERTRRDASRLPAAELVLREVKPLFSAEPLRQAGVLAAEREWSERAPAVVIGALSEFLDAPVPALAERDPRLPLFDPAFAERLASDPAAALAELEVWRGDGEPQEPALLESAAAAWRARFAGTPNAGLLRAGFDALFLSLEDAFQRELRQRLELVRTSALEDGALTAGGKLAVSKTATDRADERALYILKDRGSRRFVAVARPSYPLVNLLTRYPQHLRGFEVERVHSRVHPTCDTEGRAIARLLVGRLAPPSVARRLGQRETLREIAVLEERGGGDEETDALRAELSATLDRPDEEVGAFGIERWFERELAGRNGFRESRGLAEREADARGRAVVERVDGETLTTTLDAALQAEAEYCLEHPEGDPRGSSDLAWQQAPTGAIVLITPAGEVLAAASVPLVARPNAPGRAAVTDEVRERTLTKPDFQPPGSVFKMFVAAFALDRFGLDPATRRDCSAAANPGGHGPGYKGVHCHESGPGHGPVDLRRALRVSCNSYFAWLGEQYDQQAFIAMAHEFGFGEPTGIRMFDGEGRSGLREDCVPGLFKEKPIEGRSLREAGNGLSVVEATPMQIARATAAIATGVLPEIRIVRRIGERELAPAGRPLSISKHALDIVRAALVDVTQDNEGSAHSALSLKELGFMLAAKTGSADLTSTAVEDGRVLKHTWVAGWFPAENPVGILVVFEHRTTRTSNFGAIWLARQFLKRPAVSAWIAEQSSAR